GRALVVGHARVQLGRIPRAVKWAGLPNARERVLLMARRRNDVDDPASTAIDRDLAMRGDLEDPFDRRCWCHGGKKTPDPLGRNDRAAGRTRGKATNLTAPPVFDLRLERDHDA